MKINQPSFEIWEQMPGADGVYRQVERCGRVCYKSENHQTADSARPFVERMIAAAECATRVKITRLPTRRGRLWSA